MPHCNTILSQLLKIVGRHEFEKIASAHHEGQRLRKTSRWSQFVALAFGQLGGRQSLRDIESNLNAQRQYSYHLGGTPITRSSLARLNSRQPASCYEALFYQLYNRCAKHAPSTVSGLRTRFMPWTLRSSTCRSSCSLGRITLWARAQ